MKRIYLHTILSFATILASAQGRVNDPFDFRIEAAAGDTVDITIKGSINEWAEYASANSISSKITELVAQGVQNANIYINTRGGDTIEAVAIVNELRKLPGKLIATGGAVVASAGSYIACKCDEFHVAPNTQFMYHRPKMGSWGTVDEIKSNLKLLENTEEDYIKTYAAKTGMAETEIVEAWSKGDQWMMGEEIVKAKFADKLIKKEAPITALDVTVLEACAAPVVPTPTVTPQSQSQNSNKIFTEMEKNKLIVALGLSADATDAQIEAAVIANKQKADAAAQAQAEAVEKANKQMVANAIADKKITADQEANYLSFAKADPVACKAALDALKPLEKPFVTPSASTEADADKSKWTYQDYQEKAPEAFLELLKTDPAKAEALADAHYKS